MPIEPLFIAFNTNPLTFIVCWRDCRYSILSDHKLTIPNAKEPLPSAFNTNSIKIPRC